MTNVPFRTAIVLMVSVCVAGCGSGQTDGATGQTCSYNGKTYPNGAGGKPLSATDAAAKECDYNGKTYPTEVYFSSANGCDECHCRADGLVTCTFLHSGC